MLNLLLVALIALVTTTISILLIKPLSKYIGWIDHPGGHKKHQHPTPLIGGFTIYLGILIALIVCGCISEYLILLTALTILLIVGIIDDVKNLSPIIRFGAQAISVLILIYFDNCSILDLGGILGNNTLYLGSVSPIFTIFGIVGLINAINLSDGMDGLAAGLTAIALIWMGLIAVLFDIPQQPLAIIIISLGAICGFLIFNLRHPWRKRAAIFMGDSGSLVLGLLLGWVSIKLTSVSESLINTPMQRLPPVVVLWLIAIPLLDTVSVMIRRILRRRNPFLGDREHVHHLLLKAGFSHGQVVAFLLISAALFGGFGFSAWQLGVPESLMLLTFLMLFGLYLWITFRAWRVAHYAKLIHNFIGNTQKI